MTKRTANENPINPIPKTPTGIGGLDEITGGGLPSGRSTLISGNTGCGKTMLAMAFLAHGAMQFNEPGVFMAFEETREELTANFRGVGYDLEKLIAEKQMFIDEIRLDPGAVMESGRYDLGGLFRRIDYAVETVGARRIAIDSIEALFSFLSDQSGLRAEIYRLIAYLKQKGLTTVLTAESGEGRGLGRHNIEAFVADCVIVLSREVAGQVSTRHLRIMKYRGSAHGTNAYPFLIGKQGISLMPVTALALDYEVPYERISTGIGPLDAMFSGGGYFRGASVLISGTAGSGKSSLVSSFADAVCRRGEKCLYFSFEESPAQITRNMGAIGLDLQAHVENGRLLFKSTRPTAHGLEDHLLEIHEQVAAFDPDAVIVDPISNLVMAAGHLKEAKKMLMRLIDLMKHRGITTLSTDLMTSGSPLEKTEVGISSLMDTWLLLRNIEDEGEHNRTLYILKSRGMAHSNQVREFLITDDGLALVDVYISEGRVYTGSARLQRKAGDDLEHQQRKNRMDQLQRLIERKQQMLDAKIAAMQAEFSAEREGLENRIESEKMENADRIPENQGRSPAQQSRDTK